MRCDAMRCDAMRCDVICNVGRVGKGRAFFFFFQFWLNEWDEWAGWICIYIGSPGGLSFAGLKRFLVKLLCFQSHSNIHPFRYQFKDLFKGFILSLLDLFFHAIRSIHSVHLEPFLSANRKKMVLINLTRVFIVGFILFETSTIAAPTPIGMIDYHHHQH